MARRKYEPVELTNDRLSEVIDLRERGYTIAEAAHRAGVRPWQIAGQTKFVKSCVTTEEWDEIERRAAAHGLTMGQLMADVFNAYIGHYDKRRLKAVP